VVSFWAQEVPFWIIADNPVCLTRQKFNMRCWTFLVLLNRACSIESKMKKDEFEQMRMNFWLGYKRCFMDHRRSS